MKKILVMLLFLLVVPTYVLGGQSYISDNKIHKKWLSYILNGSNGSRVRISTNNNNLHFAVDFLYNGLAISLACPAQASNTAKNLNINVNILIDDNYEMQTSAACFVENGFLYMNIDIPNMDFINQLARGKEVAFTLYLQEGKVNINFSLLGFTDAYNRALILENKIYNYNIVR